MTYSGFMWLLRSLVLFGLCLSSSVHAGPVFTFLNGWGTASSPSALCASAIGRYVSSIYSVIEITANTCFYGGMATANPGSYVTYNATFTAGCPTTDVWNITTAGAPPLLACIENCSTVRQDASVVGNTADYKADGRTCGIPVVPLVCPARTVKSGSVCVEIPTCVSPQVLNAAGNACETPPCPSGTMRKTTGASCTPISCVAPMIKVGDVCQLPTCPSGSTYTFKNGQGQCEVMGNPCPSPKTLINDVCHNPACAAGTSLNSAGQCVATTGAGPTGSSGGSGTGTSGGTSGTQSPNPVTSTTTGTTTTTNTSTGSTSTTTSTTTSPGTSAAGTCATPPCGACDPAVNSCGTTFGGSCSETFTCTGDAVQCAVAKATNKSECDLQAIKVKTEENPQYQKGLDFIAAGAGGTKRPGEAGGAPVTEKQVGQLDTNNPFGSSCPADVSMGSYKGTELKIPLSKYCNIFQIMGQIMIVIAGIVSILIVIKGV